MNIIDTRKNGTGYIIKEDTALIGKDVPVYAYCVFLNNTQIESDIRINIRDAIKYAKVALENAK